MTSTNDVCSPCSSTTNTKLITKRITQSLSVLCSIALLSACGGSDATDTETYIKFYNASPDSPSIYMTLDEDIDNDEDDELERTYSAVAYGKAGSRITLEDTSYYVELAWQGEDSNARNDLTMIYQEQLSLSTDTTHWVVLSHSMNDPQVNIYSIPLIDDDIADDDQDNDLVNIRLVNLHETITDVDIYLSESDETFNEAEFVTSLAGTNLSDNFKIAEDQYKLYITAAGSDDVLFISEEINYIYSGQYLLAMRANQGVGGSEFVVDNISNASITQFDAEGSSASVRIYNGLDSNELLPEYSAVIDANITSATSQIVIDDLPYASFSESFSLDHGDYRFNIANDDNGASLLSNRLISLPQNTNKTVFLYWTDEAVDDDNDGIVDEDSDGVVDEIRPVISSLVVDNSDLTGLYAKRVTLLNLVNTDLFTGVSFYFVKSDEIIDTAEIQRTIGLGATSNVTLRNNSYQVFAIANIDNNEIILDELSLTVDETTSDLFLILEHQTQSSEGFALRAVAQ